MSKIIDDLKLAIEHLKTLNGDASDEMSKTVGVSAQKVREAIKAIEDKISDVVRRKLAGEPIDKDSLDDVV